LKIIFFAGAALCALAAAPAWAQGPVSGRLGTVNDQVVPGATIRHDGQPVGATAAAGSFALPAVPAGPHQLSFTVVGFSSINMAVATISNQKAVLPSLSKQDCPFRCDYSAA